MASKFVVLCVFWFTPIQLHIYLVTDPIHIIMPKYFLAYVSIRKAKYPDVPLKMCA